MTNKLLRAILLLSLAIPAAGQQAAETVRLRIPASTTYATETEVPLKTALLEWVVTTTHHKHYDEGFTAMVVVLSNLEMGCQELQPGRYGPYIPELSKEVELPLAQKDSDFLVRLSYVMTFEPRKTDRGLLGELAFGKDSKEFKPLATLAFSSINFHYLYYFLNHISGKNNYYQSSMWVDPAGHHVLARNATRSEWHFDVSPSDMLIPKGDRTFVLPGYGSTTFMSLSADHIPINRGMLALTKQDGDPIADLDILGVSGIRQNKMSFSMRGKLHLTECPTSVNAYDMEKNKK